MRGFVRDESGISAILGFILVIALVMMTVAAYLSTQMPQDWREAEWETMQEVKSSFTKLREEIQDLGAGQVAAVKVRMGTPAPTAMVSATTNAALEVFSALNICDLKENRYYDDENFFRTRAYGTYVVEGSGQNYTYDTYDNDHLYVSAYTGNRIRTYLKFNLRDSFLYDSYAGEFEEDIWIHDVQLLLYVESNDPVTEPSELLEAGPPAVIEPWLIAADDWDEGIDWPGPHNESTDTRLEEVDANDYNEWLALEGYNFELSRIVKNHWNELRDNQIYGRPCEDNILSFVIREAENSSLRNRVVFTSRDNYDGGYDFSPRLRITYYQLGRPAKVSEGLVDFGYIRYAANNEFFPSQVYIYEGGMVIIQRDPDWYETLLKDPPGFITMTRVGTNDIRVTVRRYQIEESSIPGESIGGTGYTSIRVQREEVENIVGMPSSPNRTEATITVRTDHKSAWRDYLERLAAELNYKMSEWFDGVGEWDQYGKYVKYDYDSVSLTINGKDLNRDGTQDIYYAEQVIWLDTTLGTFAGGRT